MTAPADTTTATIRIEPLGAEVLPEVEALSARAFDPLYGEAWTKAQCLSVLSLPGYRLLGAWIDAANAAPHLAGFRIDRSVADESELLLLAVDPAHHRAGIASRLMDDWLTTAEARTIARAYLEMRSDNPARALYAAYKFRQVGVRPAYYRGRDGIMRDAVTMERKLLAPQ